MDKRRIGMVCPSLKNLKQTALPALLWVAIVCVWSVPAQADETLRSFVSILPQKYFVERIGGEHVSVDVMVRPGQNPDTFDPTQRQMADLDRASLYFGIGVPFESVWIPRIRKTSPGLRIVDTHSGIDPKHIEANPHIWLSPLFVRSMAEKIYDALVEKDPAHQQEYQDNFEKFSKDLDQLDREIRETLKPVKKRRFMTYHPAWLHFAETYGLKEIPIEIEGKEPSPKSLATLIRKGREEGIQVIFIQKQFSPKMVEPIADALSARVVSLDPLEENYLENMRLVARSFKEAMLP